MAGLDIDLVIREYVMLFIWLLLLIRFTILNYL